jgi:hypothetical protein
VQGAKSVEKETKRYRIFDMKEKSLCEGAEGFMKGMRAGWRPRGGGKIKLIDLVILLSN